MHDNEFKKIIQTKMNNNLGAWVEETCEILHSES